MLPFVTGITNPFVSMFCIDDSQLFEDRNPGIVLRKSVRNDQQIRCALEVQTDQARFRGQLNLRIRARCIGVADVDILGVALKSFRIDWW